MKLLLDTHAALWFLGGDRRLGEDAARQLTDDTNVVLLSAAVVWEVALKRALGKLEVPEEYLALLLGAGVRPLAMSVDHAAAVEHLPAHHRDPFDRMLVAQATLEGAALVSRDDALRPYDVTLVW
ncbi:MAG: type II toxin-antitoxin system VapC family toxin [Actinobacteria bacterium]|nr:type II toxin-antitoxin system VapC family toxin [Actinomycetota bacterium]